MKNNENNIISIKIQGLDYSYNTDTHYEKDGHIYCKTCNEQIDGEPVELINTKFIFTKACKCNQERKRLEEERERQNKIADIKRRCFVERNQENFTFANCDSHTDKALIGKLKKYVEEFEEMKKNNIGLIIYGGIGTGKTFLSCSVLNDVIEKYLYECKIINFSQILNDLQKGGFNLDRNEYIGNLTSKTLLVFDDFGIERDTEYALEQIYNVINARYQKEKPTIITTNLDYKDLENGGQDLMLSRIYSRIIEMGVPLKVDGSDRRKVKRMLKIEKAKNLMDK